MVLHHAFTFVIPEPRKHFRIKIAHEHHNNILPMLFESLLTVNALSSITALEFDMYRGDSFLSPAPPSQAFHSMSSITVLNTCPIALSYLGQLKQPESLFPHLHTISLKELDGGQDANDLRVWIQPFLTNRLRTAPIQVLEFQFSFRDTTDLRFLDTLSGLKIVGSIYGDPRPLEYVCGSGDKQQLYVVQTNSQ